MPKPGGDKIAAEIERLATGTQRPPERPRGPSGPMIKEEKPGPENIKKLVALKKKT